MAAKSVQQAQGPFVTTEQERWEFKRLWNGKAATQLYVEMRTKYPYVPLDDLVRLALQHAGTENTALSLNKATKERQEFKEKLDETDLKLQEATQDILSLRAHLNDEQTEHQKTLDRLQLEQHSHDNTTAKLRAQASAHEHAVKEMRALKVRLVTKGREFDEEHTAHVQTKMRLREEKSTHGDTKDKLLAEETAHKQTREDLERERSNHGQTTSALQAERNAHQLCVAELKRVRDQMERKSNYAKNLQELMDRELQNSPTKRLRYDMLGLNSDRATTSTTNPDAAPTDMPDTIPYEEWEYPDYSEPEDTNNAPPYSETNDDDSVVEDSGVISESEETLRE